MEYKETNYEFYLITQEMQELFMQKQEDYGPTNVGMGKSVVEDEVDIKVSLMGLSIRMNDKIQRLLNLTLHNKEPKNESLEDTLIDIANYAVMGLIVNRGKWGK